MVLVLRTYLLLFALSLLWPALDDVVFYPGKGGVDVRPTNDETDWQCIFPLAILSVGLLLWQLFCQTAGTVAATPSSSWSSSSSSLASGVALALHVLDLSQRLHRMPYVWDHEQWGILLQLTVIVALALFQDQQEALVEDFCRPCFDCATRNFVRGGHILESQPILSRSVR